MIKNRKYVITGAIVVLGAALLIAAAISRQGAAAAEEITPVRGDIITYYSFSGAVEAKNRETILADRLVQVTDILVEPGQMVEVGDALMTTSFGETIRAGITGEVSTVHVEDNAQVMSGGRLADIIDYSNLQLNIKVDEYDLSALEAGKEATVTIHALDMEVAGEVVGVSREGINANGVTFFDASISFAAMEEIRVGMSAEARVINKSVQDVIILPMSAIQFDDNNEPFVFIKEAQGNDKKRKLTLGVNDGVSVEVRGISLAEVVLVPRRERNLGFGPGRVHPGDWD